MSSSKAQGFAFRKSGSSPCLVAGTGVFLWSRRAMLFVSSAQQAGQSAPVAQKPPGHQPRIQVIRYLRENLPFCWNHRKKSLLDLFWPSLYLGNFFFFMPWGRCLALETHLEARFYFNHLLSVQQKPWETKELTAPGQRQNLAWKASSYFSGSSSSRMERGGAELWQRGCQMDREQSSMGRENNIFFSFPLSRPCWIRTLYGNGDSRTI